MKVEISLDNEKIIDGKNAGGFHKTYKFTCLHGVEGLVDIIDKVTRDNFNKYGDNHVLIHALIECDDAKIVDEFNAKYKELVLRRCNAYCKKITVWYSPFDIWTD